MFKEPFIPINRISITVDNIDQRIQFKQRDDLGITEHTDIPQNRGSPHPHLQRNINDLGKIPEKDHNGTGTVAHGKHQHKQAEAVIKYLQCINSRVIPVNRRHDQEHCHEKHMDEGRRDQLDDRQNADIKYHLLHQIAVL